MPYYNHYAMQVKRLQQIVPSKVVKWAGKDGDLIKISVDNKIMEVNKESIRTQNSLMDFANKLT